VLGFGYDLCWWWWRGWWELDGGETCLFLAAKDFGFVASGAGTASFACSVQLMFMGIDRLAFFSV